MTGEPIVVLLRFLGATMECKKCLRVFTNQKSIDKHTTGPASLRRCKTLSELEQTHRRMNDQWSLKKN